MEFCDDRLSQLFDCIDSAHSEVKRKMSMMSVVLRDTKVTSCDVRENLGTACSA